MQRDHFSVADTAFFGGSFDPPHPGHLGVAQGALDSGRCRKVLWVPAWSPAHKQGHSRAAFEDRMAMVRMEISGRPGMEISGIEGELCNIPSYTFEVLEALNTPGNPPVGALLIGADSLQELHLWHRAEELVRKYAILTYPREGAAISREALAAHWPADLTEKLLSGVLPGTFFKISSSGIKKSMANSADRYDINTGDLLPDVADYVRRRGLYQVLRPRKDANMEMKEEAKPAAVTKPTPAELAEFCRQCAEDKMGEDTVLIPMTEVSSIADYFVVSTANSEPQLRAMAGAMERQVREHFAIRPLSGPDNEASGWVLIDFGTVIVHLMTRESRERYDLEGLWNHAEASRKQQK